MSNVVYLKKDDGTLIAYDKSNLASITIYNDECSTRRYEDLADINWHLGHDLQNDYFDCDKSEFDEALNNFKNNLNIISEKL